MKKLIFLFILIIIQCNFVYGDKNLYKILGLKKSASQDDIKKAYRNLAKKYHPDKTNNDQKAQDKFIEINSAAEILGDEKQRAIYDDEQRYGSHSRSRSNYQRHGTHQYQYANARGYQRNHRQQRNYEQYKAQQRYQQYQQFYQQQQQNQHLRDDYLFGQLLFLVLPLLIAYIFLFNVLPSDTDTDTDTDTEENNNEEDNGNTDSKSGAGSSQHDEPIKHKINSNQIQIIKALAPSIPEMNKWILESTKGTKIVFSPPLENNDKYSNVWITLQKLQEEYAKYPIIFVYWPIENNDDKTRNTLVKEFGIDTQNILVPSIFGISNNGKKGAFFDFSVLRDIEENKQDNEKLLIALRQWVEKLLDGMVKLTTFEQPISDML